MLLSVASVWGLVGGFIGSRLDNTQAELAEAKEKLTCASPEVVAPLASIPPGLVSAPSDMGVHILRFTQNRILSAPYHRNQGGMLTELHIGLATPADAEAFIRGTGVTTLAFCPDFAQTREIAKMKPDGLYAQLEKGNVPSYLQPLPKQEGSPVQFFRYVPSGS